MFTVLYVDDEPDLLVLGRKFLERSPEFRVVTFTSAGEALESVEIRDCHAIVSDYQMPEMDGIAFLKAVREKFSDVPFILFTGRGREEIVIQAINNGADFYIQKGGAAKAQFAELEHKIRQAIARRHAESQLVESEKRLADIINFLPDATFAIDREGRVIAWNNAIEEMTGVPAAEMLGKGNHEYTIPFYGDRRPILIDMVFENEEVLARQYTHISRDRGTLTAETTLTHPEGGTYTLMATARPLFDRQGGIAGAIESLRDISGIRFAEEALKASEEKYRLVVEHSQDAVYIHRSDRVIFANRRASELTGYTHDELMEIRVWDLLHPDDRASLIERAKKRFDGDEIPSGFTARVLTKDGRETPCEFFVDLVMYQGAPAILGIARDITVRKEAEDALRASEARFRELTELLPQIIFETDKNLRITYVNRHARTVTGLTQDDLDRGYTAFDFIAEKDHTRVKENLGKIVRGEVVDNHEYELILRDGTTFSVMIYATPILNNGVFSGLRGVILDISDRKHAEEELRRHYEELSRSEENLRLTQVSVDQASFGILWLSPEGKILYANEAESRMLGYSREELLHLSIWDIDPSRTPELYAERWKQLKTVKSWQFESEHRTKDGRIYPVNVSGRYISVGGKEFYYAFDQDITDRKKAEDALRTSEERFRELTELLPQIIFEMDKNLRITYGNRYAYTLMGVTREDLDRGFTSFDFIAQKDHARAKENLGKIARGEVVDHHEYELICRDGTTFPALIYAAPILNNGIFSGFRGIIIDISDRKRAEEALRKSEERFQMALEASNDGLFDWDLVSDTVYFSPRFLGMLGYMPGDLPASSRVFDVLLHPDDVPRVASAVREYSEGRREGHAAELQLRAKDGSWIWILSHGKIAERDPDGKPLRIVGTHTDISGRKAMEHAIQEANRKLNLLNTITRHDVINQLTAVQGYIQLACVKKPDPRVTDFLLKIQEAADTIERQITFTSLYQDLGVQAPSWFTLEKIVARASGTAVPVRFSGTCRGISVLADPMLERVFFNLFENAARHGKRVTGITVRCEREPDGLLVIVEDNGVGIKPHDKEKIFTKGYGKNTGFGLFLAREILAITAITIRETGSYGKGARFEMLVPKGAFRLPDKKE